jgi:aspartate kinase
MALYVQKFGGTSMGNLQRIAQVAEIIIKTKKQGHAVVVTVSAMSGETDRLINLAKEIQAEPTPREYAMLVSTGEQASMALLAMALEARGYKARSHTGWQAVINTDSSYKKARILEVNPERVQSDLAAGVIPIVAGFQGVDEHGEITTLGRGGSDTTAVALAASLKADECQIYTDVDGVYTADPRIVPQARRMSTITFEEMLELASLGAKVLQIRAVEFAGKYNVPLRVLSTFEPGPGTLITYEEATMEKAIISGVAYNRNEAKLTVHGVPDIPGVAFQILGPISEAGVDVDMIIQNVSAHGKTDFTFTVHRDDYEQAMAILQRVAKELGASSISHDNKIAKLSLVGVGMRSHAGIASTMFKCLAAEGINIQLISTSEIKVSVVVDEKYLELGVRALHAAFGLAAI